MAGPNDPRASRRTVGRRSRTLANGRGDPRDGRRENMRLTDQDLDLQFLEIRNSKVTLVFGEALAAAVGALLQGRGLVTAADGTLELNLGVSLGYDNQGRVAVRVQSVPVLTDNSTGTSGDGTIAAVTDVATAANAIATLAAKVNELINAATPQTGL